MENMKENAYGWDSITKEFERIYPGQDNPKHYGTLISWELGGNEPLRGISIYEYIYTGQTTGIDTQQKSNITGFITIPDVKANIIDTPNGNVSFVEFVGATDNELKAIIKH